MQKYICTVCGYIYDEALGRPQENILPGTVWREVPNDFMCPLCGATKDEFVLQQAEQKDEQKPVSDSTTLGVSQDKAERSNAQLSVIFSNLAKGCEKQYLPDESKLFQELANHYAQRSQVLTEDSFEAMRILLQKDLDYGFGEANNQARRAMDRGSLRALTWSEKVSKIINAIFSRYEKQQATLLENTKVYVCEICGFISLSNDPPEICPVCKVPSMKLMEIQREGK